jgi:hypothetical protein
VVSILIPLKHSIDKSIAEHGERINRLISGEEHEAGSEHEQSESTSFAGSRPDERSRRLTMYIFALVALGSAALWLAVERPRSSITGLIARFGALSYGIFAVITGLFWICFPATTAQLVPGHAGGVLVATATQARGLIVVAFGLVALFTRKTTPPSLRSILLGPFLYNLIMSVEAFAAQFTVLATRERWLYVALHFGWSLSFGLRFARTQAAASAFLAPQCTSRLLLSAFSALAALLGLALFTIPYGVMAGSMPIVGSAFLAHSVHGLAAACIALGALAFVSASKNDTEMPVLGPLAVAGSCVGIAMLGAATAGELGPLEASVRLAAILCALCAGVSVLRLRSR